MTYVFTRGLSGLRRSEAVSVFVYTCSVQQESCNKRQAKLVQLIPNV